MTTHSSILAWKNPVDRGAWRATIKEVAKELDTTYKLNNNKSLPKPQSHILWGYLWCWFYSRNMPSVEIILGNYGEDQSFFLSLLEFDHFFFNNSRAKEQF